MVAIVLVVKSELERHKVMEAGYHSSVYVWKALSSSHLNEVFNLTTDPNMGLTTGKWGTGNVYPGNVS